MKIIREYEASKGVVSVDISEEKHNLGHGDIFEMGNIIFVALGVAISGSDEGSLHAFNTKTKELNWVWPNKYEVLSRGKGREFKVEDLPKVRCIIYIDELSEYLASEKILNFISNSKKEESTEETLSSVCKELESCLLSKYPKLSRREAEEAVEFLFVERTWLKDIVFKLIEVSKS